MKGAPDRPRAATWIALASACLIAGAQNALALNPTLEVNQYAHTSWRIRDGFFRGEIRSIAQAADGYLWLATEFGVLRFDGVRAVPWEPSGDQRLPSSDIWSVLAGRDGSLWIGTAKGLARWKGGTLTQYAELSGHFVQVLFEDRAGTVWATGLAIPVGILCSIRGQEVACDGQKGTFGYAPWGFYEDRKGNLWLGVTGGVWKWQPEPRLFIPSPDPGFAIHGLAEDADGALLFTTRSGIRRVVGHTTEPYITTSRQLLRGYGLLRDRDGSLWIGTTNGALFHVHEGKTDEFGPADGLSGQDVAALFEDREGNVWVATENGLDRFRDVTVSRLSVKQGLPGAVNAVSAASDGGVWISNTDGVAKWRDGQLVAYRARASQPGVPNVREIVVRGLPLGAVGSVFHDDQQRTWLAFPTGFGYLRGDQFVNVRGVPARDVRSIVEDRQANIWVSDAQLGLFRISADGQIDRFPWSALDHRDFATVITPDPVRGGLWLGFFNGGVAYLVDGEVRSSYAPADGLTSGWVKGLRIGTDETIWVAAEGGLSRLHVGGVTTLSRENGLPCDVVNWAIQDDAGSLWLSMACGLVRVTREDVVAWASGRIRSITPTVFDAADGVRIQSTPTGASLYADKATDGRLWFVGLDGANVIDPRHLPFNALPPPVHVEQIIADRRTYDGISAGDRPIRLPALTRDLQIDYTALSLVAPEKNRFKVMLEGWDREWQDMGNRRQAFYNNLPPRSYRFRVIASNNSGVWNETGAALEFSVLPAYYQTLWFRMTMAAAALGLVFALYQRRLRRLAWHFNIRLEERVNERTRVARDLHDTLLQSFQAVVLRLQAVTFLPPAEARQALENVIDDAGHAIVEARDAVQGLRSATVVSGDLPSLISALGEELIASQSDERAPAVSVNVEGSPREIVPLVRDEIYRIAREALRNAFRHAAASRIEVEIRYAPRVLRLRIRDDGKGIAQEVVDGGGRTGHYGLAGMRERAELLKGTLAVWSDRGSGAEVELTIPASVAYVKTSAPRRPTPSSEAVE